MFSLNNRNRNKQQTNTTYCQNKRTKYGKLIKNVEYNYYTITIEWLRKSPKFDFMRPGRNCGPSVMCFRNGSKKSYLSIWYVDGRLGRLHDKPAVQQYGDFGELELEEWYSGGSLHRLNGPAYIRYYHSNDNEITKNEQWFHYSTKIK